jgi:ribosome recycling factor
MERFAEIVKGSGMPEKGASFEGRNLVMILAPLTEKERRTNTKVAEDAAAEAKTETKAEAKVEASAEAKAETKAEAKAETKVEASAEAKTETDSGAGTE